MQKYISDRQLADRYGVSRATVWRWAQRGILPAPEKISEQCTRWNLDDIEQRDEERKAAATE